MTGYESKKAMAQDKLEDDDDIQTYTRPWVGLTDEEVVNLGYSADGNVCTAVRLAAVYIKEKNNGTTP